MAVEKKYKVDVPQIPSDEPIILFRGKDAILPEVLAFYEDRCASLGSPDEHLKSINKLRWEVLAFQTANPFSVKVPD